MKRDTWTALAAGWFAANAIRVGFDVIPPGRLAVSLAFAAAAAFCISESIR